MTPPDRLVIDEVTIDFAARLVLRDGVPQPLETKAFDVLALLAGRPGQVFTRDQILDAVWGHRHVTPGVLNRVVTLLRQAVGEDAQHPRLLQTVHGVGYRFDLPAPVAGSPIAAAPVAGGAPGEAAPRASGVGVTGWRPRLLLATGVAVSALAAAALWTGWRPPSQVASQDTVSGATATVPTLVVLPLQPIDADADLAAGLSEELIGALARIEQLRVIARESAVRAASEAGGLQRLGASHALEGSLQQAGPRLRVRLRLAELPDGRTLWAQDYDRDASDVLDLQRDIAEAVATALTLRLGLSRAEAGGGGDADFLRRYYGVRALLESADSRRLDVLDQVEAELRRMLRERPDDARVRATLASTLNQRAFHQPHLAAALRPEALEEASLALRIDPELPEPYIVLAAAACREDRWEECMRLLRLAQRLAPSHTGVNWSLALTLAQLGYLDQAEQAMREGVGRDPLNPMWRFGLGRVLDTRGRHAEAREELEQAAAHPPYGRWFNAVWRGELDEAAAIAGTLGDEVRREDVLVRELRDSYVATTRALRDPGAWPEAETAMRDNEARTGRMNFLAVLHPQAAARAPELIGGLETVRKRAYSSWDLLLWSEDLAYLRRDPAFQDYLRRSGILAYWQAHGFPAQCRKADANVLCD